MGVWKRLQRIGKNASKFEFIVTYYDLSIKCTKTKWFPHKICVNWTRRSRDLRSQVHDWVPSLEDPFVGQVDWRIPENVKSSITLYRGQRDEEFEDKDWTFNIESVDKVGKRKIIATKKVNMKNYATVSPSPQFVSLELKPLSDKFEYMKLSFTISCSLLKEGLATDDDMISMASLMSFGSAAPEDDVNDVGNLADFDDTTSSFASFNDQIRKFIDMSEENDLPDDDDKSPLVLNDDKSPLVLNDAEKGNKAKAFLYLGTPPSSPLSQKKDDIPTSSSPLAEQGEITPVQQHRPISDNKCFDDSSPTSYSAKHEVKNITPYTPQPSVSNDLLSWAKSITSQYKGITVTNFTTSWRNGMAFCAVIHHYRKDLINMEELSPREIKHNNKIAFDAAASLGVARIIEPSDMVVMKIPDKLQVQTYLHALRSRFTGHQMEDSSFNQVPSSSCLASYIFGDVDYVPETSAISEIVGQDIHKILPTRNLSNDFTFGHVHDQTYSLTRDCLPIDMSASNYLEEHFDKALENLDDPEPKATRSSTPSPPSSMPPLPTVVSPSPPTAVCNSPPPHRAKYSSTHHVKKPTCLMTRKQLLNPFDSDDEDDDPYTELSSHESHTQPEDQPLVHEEATSDKEHLIKETHTDMKQKSCTDEVEKEKFVSHTNSTTIDENSESKKEQRYKELRARARELIQQAKSKSKKAGNSEHSVKLKDNAPLDEGCKHMIYDVNEYVYMELAGIEKDQEELDKYAAKIEVQLRRAMCEGDQKKEDSLTKQWFMLVNRKNALIHRQEQLNLLEKEENLNIRHDLLKRELRHMMALEDWEKSAYQKEKEQKLLDELVTVVDKKNAIVTQLDQQQISLDKDEETEKELRGSFRASASENSKQCVIQ